MRIPYPEAIRQAKHPRSKWPFRGPGCRLEPEAWPVIAPRCRIEPGEKIFSIGSCFARNMEAHLKVLGFNVPTADYRVPMAERPEGFGNGILNKFTPPGIVDELLWADEIRRLGVSDERLGRFLFATRGGHCIDLNLASFIEVPEARALERRGEIAQLYQHAFTADVVLITLGLIEAWWDAERGAYIQQTPTPEMVRRAPGRWQFEVLSFEKSLAATRQAIELLNAAGKPKKILLTTSPVPMARSFSGHDVIVANTYSKSVLRTVCGVLYDAFPNVDYFPSYESVMLSRADGVWGDDLLHVTTPFIGKIVARVASHYLGLHEPEGDLQQRIARVESEKYQRLFLRELDGRARNARLVEKGKGLALVAGNAEPCGVEYGPLNLAGFRMFVAKIHKGDGAPEADVILELRDAASSRVCHVTRAAIGRETEQWRVPLPPLSGNLIAALTFETRDPLPGPEKARFVIRNARFVGERPAEAQDHD